MKTLKIIERTHPRTVVYILPLRNENKYVSNSFNAFIPRLYPTFKEWKQAFFLLLDNLTFLRLYPTFKEWKRERKIY